jgi:hypothetical protein
MGTHVAVHAPESGAAPSVFPRPTSTEREPVLARPTTYGGRFDENGTSSGRYGGSCFTSGPGEYISLLL